MSNELVNIGEDVASMIGAYCQVTDVYVLHSKQTVWAAFSTSKGARATRDYMAEHGRGNSWSYTVSPVELFYTDDAQPLVNKRKIPKPRY
jgi:hypothetical protein